MDWKLVAHLEKDGRQSFAELGDKVGLSKSPCWTRVRNLEQSGIIEGYEARLDPNALGMAIQSFVDVQIELDAHAEFEAAVMDHPAIFECHTIAGENDYLLRVFARSMEHLDQLLRQDLSKLPGVHRLSSSLCMTTIKRSASIAGWAEATRDNSDMVTGSGKS